MEKFQCSYIEIVEETLLQCCEFWMEQNSDHGKTFKIRNTAIKFLLRFPGIEKIRIRDLGWKKFGSWKNFQDPGSEFFLFLITDPHQRV
jgi:hypothetical protein